MRLFLILFFSISFFLAQKKKNHRTYLQQRKKQWFMKRDLKSLEEGQYLIASEKFDQIGEFITTNSMGSKVSFDVKLLFIFNEFL